jgi:hypothetical protein
MRAKLARAVGRLDDADMPIERIFAPVAGGMKGEAGFAELHERLAAHRRKVRDEVRQQFLGGLWSKLQLYVVLWPRAVADDSCCTLRCAISRRWR